MTRDDRESIEKVRRTAVDVIRTFDKVFEAYIALAGDYRMVNSAVESLCDDGLVVGPDGKWSPDLVGLQQVVRRMAWQCREMAAVARRVEHILKSDRGEDR